MLDTGAQRCLARVSVFPRGEGLDERPRRRALQGPARPSQPPAHDGVDHDPRTPAAARRT